MKHYGWWGSSIHPTGIIPHSHVWFGPFIFTCFYGVFWAQRGLMNASIMTPAWQLKEYWFSECHVPSAADSAGFSDAGCLAVKPSQTGFAVACSVQARTVGPGPFRAGQGSCGAWRKMKMCKKNYIYIYIIIIIIIIVAFGLGNKIPCAPFSMTFVWQ